MSNFKARLANAQTAAQVRHESAVHHLRQQKILKEVLLVAEVALTGVTAATTVEDAQDIAHKAKGAMSALLASGLPQRKPIELVTPPDDAEPVDPS